MTLFSMLSSEHRGYLLVCRSVTLDAKAGSGIRKLLFSAGRFVLVHFDVVDNCGSESFLLLTAM